eukprot:12410449-Alexandrium_andersonii.AAC.1
MCIRDSCSSLSTNHEATSRPGWGSAAKASSTPSRAVPIPSKSESSASGARPPRKPGTSTG